jgi:tetratricopeptide (TPR) repeat protein
LSDLERAGSLDPENPEVLLSLGALREKYGNFQGATDAFRKLVKIRPEDASAHYNLGIALGKQGLFREAAVELTRSIDLDPSFRDALLRRAIVFEFLGYSERARKDFARAMQLPESSPTLLTIRPPVNTAQLKQMLGSP